MKNYNFDVLADFKRYLRTENIPYDILYVRVAEFMGVYYGCADCRKQGWNYKLNEDVRWVHFGSVCI